MHLLPPPRFNFDSGVADWLGGLAPFLYTRRRICAPPSPPRVFSGSAYVLWGSPVRLYCVGAWVFVYFYTCGRPHVCRRSRSASPPRVLSGFAYVHGGSPVRLYCVGAWVFVYFYTCGRPHVCRRSRSASPPRVLSGFAYVHGGSPVRLYCVGAWE